MPCHPGTYVAGFVTDSASGQAIPDAAVRLYHYQATTAASGCFALGGPDALPFEFGVSAPGYKPLVAKAVPGAYQATVSLSPLSAASSSSSTTVKVSREGYDQLSRGCP